VNSVAKQRKTVAKLTAVCLGILVIGFSSAHFAPPAAAVERAATSASDHANPKIVADLARVATGTRNSSFFVRSRNEGTSVGKPHQSVNETPCTFDGQTNDNPLPNVTPGMSITISCTGFLPSEQVFADEVSPLWVTSDSGTDEGYDVQTFMTDASGDLNATYVLPDLFQAQDPNAVCPPTTAQQQAGYLRCGLVLADNATPTNGTVIALTYTAQTGYWMVGSDGGVFAFGSDVPNYGSLPSDNVSVNNVVAVVSTPDGGGYLMVSSQGAVYALGDANYEGSLPGDNVNVNDIVGIVPTFDGGGYWLVGADGGVFAFGDAGFLGSLPLIGVHVNDIVAVVPTDTGDGYWMVGKDGGVFAFGDAGFVGSLPGIHVKVDSVVAVVPTANSGGYWMVGNDGGVFAFGNAGFVGSLPQDNVRINDIVAVVPTSTGGGYWMVGKDGGVFAFGNAGFVGSLPGIGVHVDNIVAVVAAS